MLRGIKSLRQRRREGRSDFCEVDESRRARRVVCSLPLPSTLDDRQEIGWLDGSSCFPLSQSVHFPWSRERGW